MNELNYEEKILSNYVNSEFSSLLEELRETLTLKDNNCIQNIKNESRELELVPSIISGVEYYPENQTNQINHKQNVNEGDNSNNISSQDEIKITSYKEDADVDTQKSSRDPNMEVQKEESKEKKEQKSCINRYSSSSLVCKKKEEKLNVIKFHYYYLKFYKYEYIIVFDLKKYNYKFLIQITNNYFLISDGDLGLMTRLLKDFLFSLERLRNADLRKIYHAFIAFCNKSAINKTLYYHFSLMPENQKRKPKEEIINIENEERIEYPRDQAELDLIKEGRLDVYFFFLDLHESRLIGNNFYE